MNHSTGFTTCYVTVQYSSAKYDYSHKPLDVERLY